MTEKELKKLGRGELLELLLVQTQRADELEAQLKEMKEQLSSKRISAKNAGNLAQAALQINGVFETAQAAAAQYLDNIKDYSTRCDRMITEARIRCEAMERQSIEKVEMLRTELDRIVEEWRSLPTSE